MARIALAAGMAVAGAAISVATGGLGAFAVGAWAEDIIAGAAVGGSLGSALGGALFPPKSTAYPPLNDLQVMSSAPGCAIPFGYGGFRVGGQVIWASLIKEAKTTEHAGKGGPSSTVFTYTVDLAIAFCRGPGQITRIWADSKLIYDATSKGPIAIGTGLTHHNGTEITTPFDPVFYPGSSTQDPDPTIQAAEGADSTPAFRNLIYMVLNNFPLADYGNRIPSFRAEVSINTEEEYTKQLFPATIVAASTGLEPPAYCFVDAINRAGFVLDSSGQVCQRIELTDTAGNPLDPWQPSTDYAVGDEVLDSNGNVQLAILTSGAGTSGSTAPAWNTGETVVTVDHLIHWEEIGPGPNQVPISAQAAFNPLIHGLTGSPSNFNEETFRAFGVDTQGYLWGYCQLSSSTYLVRYDPRTFQAVGAVNLGSGAGAAGGFAAVEIGNTHFVYIQTQGGSDHKMYRINAASCSIESSAATGAYFGNTFPAIDPNTGIAYVVWFLGVGSSDWTLAAWDPRGSGAVSLVQFTWDAVKRHGTECMYDPSDNSLLIFATGGSGGDYLLKFDIESQAIVATSAPFAGNSLSGIANASAYRGLVPDDGIVRLIVNGATPAIGYFDTSAFTLDSTVNLSEWFTAGTGDLTDAAYDPITNSFLCVNNGASYAGISARIFLDRISVNAQPLSDVITDLVSQAGMDTSLLDVSRVTGIDVEGYCVTRNADAKSILTPLAQAYFFDLVESDNKLVVVPRGQSVTTTIPESDLGTAKDGYELVENVIQQNDLPKFMTVLYQDPAQDYQQGKQMKFRNSKVIKTKNQTMLQLPLTLDADTAAEIAAKALATVWAERNGYDISLVFSKYLVLDPTDVVQFTYEGNPYQARISKISVGQDKLLKVSAVSEDPRNYESSAAGAPALGFQGGTILALGQTLLFVFDIPLLEDIDASVDGTSGYYFAMSSPVAGTWPGGILYSSADDVNYAEQASDTSEATYGIVVAATPAPANSRLFTWDRATAITVAMASGSLSSTDQLSVLNGANAFILGSEIMQFQTATLNADGTYTLSNLLRGMRGTEWACSEHADGETFVLLSTSTTERQALPTSVIGLAQYLKGITIGNLPSSATPQQFTLAANDLKPYAPCAIAGARDGSNNLTIAWTRRTRIGGEADWQDGVTDVPLSETSELYDVDVLNGTAVVRTFSSLTSPTASYTAAEQTTDGLTPGDPVSVNVYQRSGQVGRGFAGSATV